MLLLTMRVRVLIWTWVVICLFNVDRKVCDGFEFCDIVVCCCSQCGFWFCLLTWFVIYLFVVAHKVCDCFVF